MSDMQIVQRNESNEAGVIQTYTPHSIFDMTQDHFDRLKLLAKMYAVSAFNSGNNSLSEGDAFIIMMKGIELGMSPMTSFDFINVIQGKPAIDGKGMLALIRKNPKCKFFDVDSQPDKCTVRTQRSDGGGISTIVWTMERANQFMVWEYDKSQGRKVMKRLSDRFQWKSQPQTMLKWRAVAEAAREVYSDVIGGLYTKEELSDVIVQPDGTMQELPAETGSGSATTNTDGSVPRAPRKMGNDRRMGQKSKSDSKPEPAKDDEPATKSHFLADATYRKALLERGMQYGFGESLTEVSDYIKTNFTAGKELDSLLDLPDDTNTVYRRMSEMKAELSLQVGAPQPVAGEWSDDDKALANDTIKEIFNRKIGEFADCSQYPWSFPDLTALFNDCAWCAIENGWDFYTTQIEYRLSNNKKVMVFHLQDGLPVLDDNGNPMSIMQYGGRTALKNQVGDAYYLQHDMDQWEPSEGEVHTVAPLKLTVEHVQSGNDSGYLKVTNVTPVG
jgi:hypothetical protein